MTRTHCPYCALQCGMTVTTGTDGEVLVSGDEAFPVNRGKLCVKGFTAAAPLRHVDRLSRPLIRNGRGKLVPASWEAALDRIADRVSAVRSIHGTAALGVYGSGALTNEKAYLLGKFARVALRTPNIDYNGRYCMSSAAAASIRAFGIDRGIPFPLEEISAAEIVVLAGVNVAETMPPLMRNLEEQRNRGGILVVVDPRYSRTAELATHHLPIRPGTDAALANGLMHVLIRDGLVDDRYVARWTEGFESARARAASYWPARVERITGTSESRLIETAHLLGRARTAIVLTGRGPEQQAQGVNNALAYINVALAIGAVGREGSGYGCVTGQGNGQGGREHGQKADQLPGYRRIEDPAARAHVAGIWGIDPSGLPEAGRSAYEMLSTLGQPGGVRALFVFGSNPVVSSPDAVRIAERLRALDFLAVSDFFLSETARLADVVLPSAQWAEEDGTMTNLEGRVIRRRRAIDPPIGVKTDLEIVGALAARLGSSRGFDFEDAESVFAEMRRVTAGGIADYSGITYERIDREGGVFWPCPGLNHPGTPRLFADGFPTPSGRARFHSVAHRAPAEEPDREYPLYLTTGRLMAHYQTGTQTHRVARLESMAPRPRVQLHPTTARAHGIESAAEVTIETRRGRATFVAEITPGIRPDTVFLPFHWGDEQSANRLTNPALDPISRMPEFKVSAARIAVAREAVTELDEVDRIRNDRQGDSS